MLWLENDGDQGFTPHTVLGAPRLMITIDVIAAEGEGVVLAAFLALLMSNRGRNRREKAA